MRPVGNVVLGADPLVSAVPPWVQLQATLGGWPVPPSITLVMVMVEGPELKGKIIALSALNTLVRSLLVTELSCAIKSEAVEDMLVISARNDSACESSTSPSSMVRRIGRTKANSTAAMPRLFFQYWRNLRIMVGPLTPGNTAGEGLVAERRRRRQKMARAVRHVDEIGVGIAAV